MLKSWIHAPYYIWGDGTNSFSVDLNTNIVENTTPFLRIAATLVYRSIELVNPKFKQAKKICSVAF